MDSEDREAVRHYSEVLAGYEAFFDGCPQVLATLAACATYEEMDRVLRSAPFELPPIVASWVLSLPLRSLCAEGREDHATRVRATIAAIAER